MRLYRMVVISKDAPLPEVWNSLAGDVASKRETMAQVVAERVRAAGLRGAPVAEIKQLLDAGDLNAIEKLLDAGTSELVAAPYDVGRLGMRGGGFSSLFAGKVDKPPHQATRAETLVSQGKVDQALAEVRTSPTDRIEVDMAAVLRHLESGNLRAAYSVLEQIRPKDRGVTGLLKRFEPTGVLARMAGWFQEAPNPDSVSFTAADLGALEGRFAIMKEALTRMAGGNGTVTIGKREPTSDYKAYVERGGALIPAALVELAEKIRTAEAETEPGKHDLNLSNMYSRAASQMLDIRNQLYTSSPIQPRAALRLARTVERSTPEAPMVHEAQVYQDLAEAISMAGPAGMGTVHWLSNNGTRANAHQGFRDLNIGFRGDGKKSTVFHEFGHHVEFNHPEVMAACRAFLDQRCADEAQPLRLLIEGSHYRPDELARPDHFITPYVGKVYNGNNTEVVSVGLEHLTDERSMVKLLVADPEHLFLTLGIVLATRP